MERTGKALNAIVTLFAPAPPLPQAPQWPSKRSRRNVQLERLEIGVRSLSGQSSRPTPLEALAESGWTKKGDLSRLEGKTLIGTRRGSPANGLPNHFETR